MNQRINEMKENKEHGKPCKVCDELTKNLFNISFTATPICESCANAIFLQQAKWLTLNSHPVENTNDRRNKSSVHITRKLKRELVLRIDPDKLYPVRYWFANQSRERINTPSALHGRDLTENQIVDLWKDGII